MYNIAILLLWPLSGPSHFLMFRTTLKWHLALFKYGQVFVAHWLQDQIRVPLQNQNQSWPACTWFYANYICYMSICLFFFRLNGLSASFDWLEWLFWLGFNKTQYETGLTKGKQTAFLINTHCNYQWKTITHQLDCMLCGQDTV